MGSRREARMAGATPKTTPTSIENPKDNPTDQRGIVVWINWPIKSENKNPRIIPINPPRPDRVKASIKNWFLISLSLAPKAFLKPISLVRSVTETSMIFIMPMPPTIKEIAAIPPKAKVKTEVIWEIVDKVCSWVWIVKSSKANLLDKIWVAFCWISFVFSGSLEEIIMLWILSSPNCFWAVTRGIKPVLSRSIPKF